MCQFHRKQIVRCYITNSPQTAAREVKETVNGIYPKSLTQLCVVHQVRNTLSYVRAAHKQAVAGDLKSIYKSSTLPLAKDALLKVKAKWVSHYPRLFNSRIDKIETLSISKSGIFPTIGIPNP